MSLGSCLGWRGRSIAGGLMIGNFGIGLPPLGPLSADGEGAGAGAGDGGAVSAGTGSSGGVDVLGMSQTYEVQHGNLNYLRRRCCWTGC